MTMTYFNDLREKGVVVNQDDTIWFDTFYDHVLTNKIYTSEKIEKILNRTILIAKEGQSTTDIIGLIRKLKIDFEPIDKKYEISLTKWKELINDFKTMAVI